MLCVIHHEQLFLFMVKLMSINSLAVLFIMYIESSWDSEGT